MSAAPEKVHEAIASAEGSPSNVYLSIVVPIFNEEENIAALVAEVEAVRGQIGGATELILVDDGSTDRTWREIVESCRKHRWIRGLRFLANRGQTAAMVAGVEASRGDLIAFLDADMQNDPRDLPRMIEPIRDGEVDMMCGWRADRKDSAIRRTLPSRIANFVIRRAFRLNVHDLGCTLRVSRRVFLEDVELYGEMHRYLVCYAQAQGARIGEVKVNHRPRRAGVSKYGLNRIGKVLIDLLTAKMINSYGSKPAYFFGKIALLFFILGTIAFSIVTYRTFALDKPESTPMIFVWLMCYIAGLICLMSGLLAELNIRVAYHVGERRQPYRIVDTAGGPESDLERKGA